MTDLHDDEPLDDEQTRSSRGHRQSHCGSCSPGSGKTRTLSHRARHLLTQDPGSRALLITFTNKAAAEMKTRALRFGNLDVNRIKAGTFHQFGLSLLRSIHGKLVGIAPDVGILDAEEAKQFAAEVAAATGTPDRRQQWSECRLRDSEPSVAAAAFGKVYEAAKRDDNAVDFDDLVVYPARLLVEQPQVAELYGNCYEHVLVDEVQDTNPAHFSIVHALCPYVKTVSVFADDDQAIMRFAGADAENIHRFIEKLGAHELPLRTNYRCRDAIVHHGNLLIAADPDHSGRRMCADRDGGSVGLRRFSSEAAEAQAIAAEIAGLILREKNPRSGRLYSRASSLRPAGDLRPWTSGSKLRSWRFIRRGWSGMGAPLVELGDVVLLRVAALQGGVEFVRAASDRLDDSGGVERLAAKRACLLGSAESGQRLGEAKACDRLTARRAAAVAVQFEGGGCMAAGLAGHSQLQVGPCRVGGDGVGGEAMALAADV